MATAGNGSQKICIAWQWSITSRKDCGSRSFCRSAYGQWVKGDALQTMNIYGQYADEYDLHRPFYPPCMFDDIVHDLGGCTDGIAVDIAAGTGRGAVELARRGFKTTAVDLDKRMLSQASLTANKQSLWLDTVCASAENTQLDVGSASLVVSLQAFHWFRFDAALAEFHRILIKKNQSVKPCSSCLSASGNGVLLLGWNDRDLTVPWVDELECVFEKYNPTYSRFRRQAEDVLNGGQLLTQSGHFDLVDIRRYSNPSSGVTYAKLLSLLKTLSYVRNSIYTTQDGEDNQLAISNFEQDIFNIVQKHHGDKEFTFPWVTKAYILQPKS